MNRDRTFTAMVAGIVGLVIVFALLTARAVAAEPHPAAAEMRTFLSFHGIRDEYDVSCRPAVAGVTRCQATESIPQPKNSGARVWVVYYLWIRWPSLRPILSSYNVNAYASL